MITDNIEFKPEGDIIACPNCLVCSMALSTEEQKAVNAGQQMIITCKICGKDVVLNN